MGTYGSSWQHGGYSGNGNVAVLLNSEKGRPAIVAGAGEGVFAEIRASLEYHPDAIIFAANEVGIYLPRVDHFVSLHSHNLAVWKMARWLHPKDGDTQYHGIDRLQSMDWYWEQLTPLMPLSGYFAMQIAYIMGCAPIILCGVPGDGTRRFFDLYPKRDFFYGSGEGGDRGIRDQLESEMERVPEFRARVVSMSGWTNRYFGGL